MDKTALITQIHASPVMVVLAVTGGGAQAVADLLAVPGASRTVLEAVIPYSQAAQSAFLGKTVDQSVTAEAAAALARAAYRRALRLRTDEALPVIGLACTAALATDRPKKGDHRAHIGLAEAEGIRVWSLTLHKGARDRSGEEQVVTALLLSLLAEACGLGARQKVGLLAQERLIVAEFPSTFAL
ncbi:MAG: CinA family protein [Desulfurellaceae bacterium]|nr:CinA family protein [Desulfurellaceae bacterium]